MKNKALLFLIFCSTFQCINAQVKTDSVPSLKQKFHKNYLRSYLRDSKDILLAPVHWQSKSWITFGALTAVTILASTQDVEVYNYVNKHHSETMHDIGKYGLEPWGSGNYSMPLMALFYGYGFLANNEQSKKTALLGVKAYLVAAIFVTPAKQLLHRHRPYHDSTNQYIIDGPFAPGTNFSSTRSIWDGLKSETKYTSAPSGHTMSVFAVASVVASEYRKTVWVPIVAYTIAGLSGLSRIESGNHWVSDVCLGAAFGYAIGTLISNKNNWGVQISPNLGRSKASLDLLIPLQKNKLHPSYPALSKN